MTSYSAAQIFCLFFVLNLKCLETNSYVIKVSCNVFKVTHEPKIAQDSESNQLTSKLEKFPLSQQFQIIGVICDRFDSKSSWFEVKSAFLNKFIT